MPFARATATVLLHSLSREKPEGAMARYVAVSSFQLVLLPRIDLGTTPERKQTTTRNRVLLGMTFVRFSCAILQHFSARLDNGCKLNCLDIMLRVELNGN